MITIDELVSHYPILYHMAARDSWPSIKRNGLLSTSALLDLFGIAGSDREAIERQHRPNIVTIQHPDLGTAKIRDQKPMSDAGLVRALTGGLTPTKWYVLLNSKVFFWTSRARLHRLLCAKAYRNEEHDVIFVDSGSVVRAYASRVTLCPINSGATKPFPHERNATAFSSVSDYPWGAWVKKRGVEDAVVEVAFTGGIPDITDSVIRVVRMKGDEELSIVYER